MGLDFFGVKRKRFNKKKEIENIIISGEIEGKRCKGRQRITYTKSLSEWMNVEEVEMIRLVEDRDIWKTTTVKAGNWQDTGKKKKIIYFVFPSQISIQI